MRSHLIASIGIILMLLGYIGIYAVGPGAMPAVVIGASLAVCGIIPTNTRDGR